MKTIQVLRINNDNDKNHQLLPFDFYVISVNSIYDTVCEICCNKKLMSLPNHQAQYENYLAIEVFTPELTPMKWENQIQVVSYTTVGTYFYDTVNCSK